MGRDSTIRTVLRLYAVVGVVVRDVEVLVGVVAVGVRHVVAHGDGDGYFVLHVSVCSCSCGSVSIQQRVQVHVHYASEAVPPLLLRREQDVPNRW